ncbi:glycosyltransferase [Candidatus Magnetomonas plexicatena]|uniref:glycosyltransferase n=1 Tax=Candidatus Magnetomonas plexicatena TaxID=2552947 RepID=UPI0011053F9E|nr:glycosyltransferase family 4 protein [Nitrospirales bacterium LBB_01]
MMRYINPPLPSLIMALYGEIDYDGRVQRVASALGELFDVTVYSIDSGRGYKSDAFRSEVVELPPFRSGFKALRFFYFWVVFVLYAARVRPAIIYANDSNVTIPCFISSVITRSKFVYDAHELFIPDAGSEFSLRAQFYYRLEWLVIKRAKLVIAANAERAEIMRAHYNLKAPPLVIPNIPPQPSSKINKDELLKQYPILKRDNPDRIRLVYQGDINYDRGLKVLYEAMKHLDDKFELLFVGGGISLEVMRAQAALDGLDDKVLFSGRVPRDYLFDVLQSCDIGVVIYISSSKVFLYCAPNKIYEYIQAGLPVLATCQPPLKTLVDTFNVGRLVGCKDNAVTLSAEEFALEIKEFPPHYEKYKSSLDRFLAANRWEDVRVRLLSAFREL